MNEEIYPVLDKGFIRLVDTMGDDMSVVKAARVSYGKESKGKEADKKLINYLMKHNHGTPFEHLNFTFHIKAPIFVARQWFRHRIGSFNEISGRYVTLKLDFWTPDEWRTNNKKNKQSSGDGAFHPQLQEELIMEYMNTLTQTQKTYEKLLKNGVAREQARGILPVSTYTEFYWTVNARSLFNFIKLRSHKTAQKEIQEYSNIIHLLVKNIAPWTFEAFETHNLNYTYT